MKTKRGLPDMTWIPDRQLWRKRGTYKGQKYNLTSKTPEGVMEKIEEFKANVDRGLSVEDDITVSAYAARWLPLRVAGMKPKSADVYNNALMLHILPKIGSLQIRDVKPMHIDELLAGITGLSLSMNNKILFATKQLFNSALENDLISKNPCVGRKPGGSPTKKKTPLTKAQQETLTTAVRETRAELFTLLCLYAGLRREEALGLLWSNVHLDDMPYIDVRHTVTYDTIGNATHSENLKTKAAYRSIPIPPQLSEALLRWRGRATSLFVVPAERTGREMSATAFRRMWQIISGHTELVKKKGKDGEPIRIEVKHVGVVDFHVEPHQLRHTYITELCASGIDIKKIQYLAGHSKVQMTLDIYTHVTQNKPEQLASDIIRAFSGTPTGTPMPENEHSGQNKQPPQP